MDGVAKSIHDSMNLGASATANRVFITIKNRDTNKDESGYPTYNSATDKWEYIFEVTNNTPNGNWDVEGYLAYDAIGNIIPCVSPGWAITPMESWATLMSTS